MIYGPCGSLLDEEILQLPPDWITTMSDNRPVFLHPTADSSTRLAARFLSRSSPLSIHGIEFFARKAAHEKLAPLHSCSV